MQLRLITGSQLRALVDMPTAIDLMSDAFGALSAGRASMPLRSRVDAAAGATLLMPAFVRAAAADSGEPDALAAKIVSVFPGNRERGLPAVHAVVVVLDPETGAPVALVDGETLTALRTGAASGLATRLLARDDASVLAVFGAGAQAPAQIEAVRAVRPIREIRIVSRSGASARALAGRLSDDDASVRVRAVATAEAALEGADVVVAATDSATPVFPGDRVPAGAHVNGVGSFTREMREVDGALVSRAVVVVDDRDAALREAGDLIQAIEEGTIGEDDVRTTLGDLVLGRRPGRTGRDDVTFFKSVGVAIQDVAVAACALRRARRDDVGRVVEL